MPTETVQKMLKGGVVNGYKKIEEMIKRNGGDYLLGSQITLADFYLTVWVIPLVDLGVMTLDSNPELSNWFERVQQFKEIKDVRNKFQGMVKKIKFFLTWIMPIVNCCTCKCCCPKKK
jgi:glutathione S-transferase